MSEPANLQPRQHKLGLLQPLAALAFFAIAFGFGSAWVDGGERWLLGVALYAMWMHLVIVADMFAKRERSQADV